VRQAEERSGQMDARSRRNAAVQAHPLQELLECPRATGNLLDGAAQCIAVEEGAIVFRQGGICRGLYLLVSGQFLRRAERFETRLILGLTRAGNLVELGAVLGDGRHTYTLIAQTAGSVILLPMAAVSQAFEAYPRLRMHLLEELAREVSRGYAASCQNRKPMTRWRHSTTPAM